MAQYKVDILAFGAHSDDVEIGMAGSICKWTKNGRTAVICDLTEAELSSNGSVKTRHQEAAQAATCMGVEERLNLRLPDRGLILTDEYIRQITNVIRQYQPKLVFAPFPEDRHPDHGRCAELVKEAFFSAGIRKYETSGGYNAHKAKNLFYYFINSNTRPDFVVDITDFMEKKMSVLQSYQSQFLPGPAGIPTPLTDGYLERVQARERIYGLEAGITYAEGFKTDHPILVNKDIFGEGL
ncbi:bacillithiol biosynthesis deacetylase BshB1 [Siminovitchia sediminis]|uniref:Bacillithiol biosynthesis deacetylase BshB1 n=1 Tax=Siminovitchia sediminis TaxID=1274353 RepID=A0ABW4KGJ7_9BACI